jgi:glycosyltransferase involved in cell wall biosynthesis
VTITIAIPTQGRLRYLIAALKSALGQTYRDVNVLIVDNAPESVEETIAPYRRDKRLRYIRNTEPLSLIDNWNRCLDLATSPWLLILGDDDILSPRFAEASLAALPPDKQVAFTFARCTKIGPDDEELGEWGYTFIDPGYHEGHTYIHRTLEIGWNLTNSSTTMLSVTALRALGGFAKGPPQNSFDFNTWIQLADRAGVVFVDQTLCRYRIHPGQVSEIHWRQQNTGRVATKLELMRAIAVLLRAGRIDCRNAAVSLSRLSNEAAEELAAGWIPGF